MGPEVTVGTRVRQRHHSVQRTVVHGEVQRRVVGAVFDKVDWYPATSRCRMVSTSLFVAA
jgi:hypothetical protein